MKLRLLAMCVLAMLCGVLPAHNTKTVEATYIYIASRNESLEAACEKALERAKLQAIADEFGTLVTQTDITHVVNRDGESSIDFEALGGTEVKGEWLETIGEPEFKEDWDAEKKMHVVTCKVKGRIREIKSAAVDFEAKLLYNYADLQSEKYEFRHGEKFYLSFRAPVNGYVAVYMVDNISGRAFRLLPDRYDDDGQVQVKREKQYCFFSKRSAPRGQRVSEYMATCHDEVEVNYLYILFSPNRFFKALDNPVSQKEGTDLMLPNSLTIGKFQKWLTKCRVKDDEMRVEIKSITCRKKE